MRTLTMVTLLLVLAGGVPAATDGAAVEVFGLRMDGKAEEALAVLEKAVAENGKDAAAWFELARTRFYLMRFPESLEAIAKACELAPESARYRRFEGLTAAYHAISLAHDPATREQMPAVMARAVKAYEKAVVLDPSDLEARLKLVETLNNAPEGHGRDVERAKAHAAKLGELDPVYSCYAKTVLLPRDEEGKSVEMWRKVVAEHESSASAHEYLGLELLYAGEVDAGMKEIEKALELDPKRPRVLVRAVAPLARAKANDRAEQLLQRYLKTEPAPPAPMRAYATFVVARLAETRGDMKKAKELFDEAKAIDAKLWTTMRAPPEELFTKP